MSDTKRPLFVSAEDLRLYECGLYSVFMVGVETPNRVIPLAPTQGADARPVAIYQVEQAPGRWTNVSRETFDAWAFGKQIVYATRDAAPSDGQDAERYRWLQRQRSSVWHEVADMPINKATEFIDAAIAPRGKT